MWWLYILDLKVLFTANTSISLSWTNSELNLEWSSGTSYQLFESISLDYFSLHFHRYLSFFHLSIIPLFKTMGINWRHLNQSIHSSIPFLPRGNKPYYLFVVKSVNFASLIRLDSCPRVFKVGHFYVPLSFSEETDVVAECRFPVTLRISSGRSPSMARGLIILITKYYHPVFVYFNETSNNNKSKHPTQQLI